MLAYNRINYPTKYFISMFTYTVVCASSFKLQVAQTMVFLEYHFQQLLCYIRDS